MGNKYIPINNYFKCKWTKCSKWNNIDCLQETDFISKDTQTKVWGQKNIFHASGNKKKAEIVILISEKIDFQSKTVTRDKGGHHIVIKGSIQQEDITTVNIYSPNRGASKYLWEELTNIKGRIDSNTIIKRDLQHTIYINGRIIQVENQYKNIGLK